MIVYLPLSVEASAGLPGTAKFGYGAVIDINGKYLDESITTAASIGLDWIAVEFDWEKMWSDPNSPPNISLLSEVIDKAYQRGLSVLLTISNPPIWAITERGPDPQTTANLILSLVGFYANKVSAVELFPGVNTLEGCKAAPDPRSYLLTLNRVQETLNFSGRNIEVITTLTPMAIKPSPQDVNDLEFLNQLYQSGGKSYLNILGVKFNKIRGNPYSNPESVTLRHYEEIRTMMLNNEHEFGLIWITGFRWLNGEINNFKSDNTPPKSLGEHSNWLEEAFILMKAQLYIGAAFLDRINPHNDDLQNYPENTLILQDSQIHPAADQIRLLIRQQNTKSQLPITGTSDQKPAIKSLDAHQTYLTILLKKHIKQTDFKHP